MAGWIAFLAACQPASAPPSPTAERTATPVATATPVFEAELLGLSVSSDGRPGDWLVIGLLGNGSSFAVSDIQLSVQLEDARGEQLAESTVQTALPHLGPGEVTPFEASFRGVGAVSGAKARLLFARRTSLQRLRPEVSSPEILAGEDGSTLLLGEIANPGPAAIAVDGLVYLGTDASNEPVALAVELAGPSWLAPGTSSPFLASIHGSPEAPKWVAYVDAQTSEAQPESIIALDGSARLQFTAQGRPFVIGTVVNSGDQPRTASLLLILRADSKVHGVAGLVSPFPIGPGEHLPFGQTEFPGLTARLAALDVDPAVLQVEAWVDPRASAPAPDHRVQLEVRIDSFSSVGSAVFLRGAVTNPLSMSVTRPSLYAALRTTEGELLSAGWRELAPRLAAGERLEFVLDLPLPEDADPAMTEFDVVAFALEP